MDKVVRRINKWLKKGIAKTHKRLQSFGICGKVPRIRDVKIIGKVSVMKRGNLVLSLLAGTFLSTAAMASGGIYSIEEGTSSDYNFTAASRKRR